MTEQKEKPRLSSFDWVVVLWGAALLVGSVSYLGKELIPYPAFLEGEKLAAWVQAVGSIAAIVGAYWVARWQLVQNRMANELQRRQELATRIEGHARLLMLLRGAIQNWAFDAPSAASAARDLSARRIHDVGALLLSVRPETMPSENTTLALMMGIRGYREACAFLLDKELIGEGLQEAIEGAEIIAKGIERAAGLLRKDAGKILKGEPLFSSVEASAS